MIDTKCKAQELRKEVSLIKMDIMYEVCNINERADSRNRRSTWPLIKIFIINEVCYINERIDNRK